jgi:uncharacterized tellurite resistance protein B-like protein
MAQGLLAKLREVMQGNSSVRRVADDPALMAELLLLFRMVLVDGDVHERELDTIRRIASENFGIDGDDLDKVLRHLQSFGYEITPAQAIAVFQEFDMERRLLLARHLAEVAKADEELSRYEVRLIARVVEMLDLDPKAVVNGSAGAST